MKEQTASLIKNELVIEEVAIAHLRGTVGWGRLIAILGFLFSSAVAVIGLFVSYKESGLGWRSHVSGVRLAESGGIAFLYIATAFVLFFTSLQLFKFAKKTGQAVDENNQEALTAALKNLKIYFRVAGIISIVALLFTILTVISLVFVSTYSRY